MNYVITIARGFGSGGKEIAVEVSKKLNINCYEKEILQMASNKSGIGERFFHERDERLRKSFLARFLKPTPRDYEVEPSDKKFIGDDNLFQIQKGIIQELAKTESCVIVGKCADSVLDISVPALRVYIDAPMSRRIRSVSTKMHISEMEAQEYIIRTEKYRSDYYEYYTKGKKWKDPMNYDLYINTGVLSVEKAANIIVYALKEKYPALV